MNTDVSIDSFTDLALDVATALIAAGAHSGRVHTNLKRLAQKWGFGIELNLTFNAALITVRDASGDTLTRYKNTPPVHLERLTEYSRMTWKVADGELSFDEAQQEARRISQSPSYNDWLVAVAVGFSCACLCSLAGGSFLNGCIAFLAAFFGSIVRVHIVKWKFNPMISFVVASFVTSLIAGMDTLFSIGSSPEATLATAVLYLVPGVPLMNSIIDLIEEDRRAHV